MSIGKKRYYTTFTKMILFFVIFGLAPLLILSILFFCYYSKNVRETSVRNYSQIIGYFAKNIGDVLDSVDEAMGAMYDYETENGGSLALVLSGESISESNRQLQVDAALRDVMEQSEYISSVRFVDAGGNLYSRHHDQEKTLRNDAYLYTKMDVIGVEEKRDMKLLGAAEESKIRVNSDDYIFSLVRNFMDTSTIGKAYEDALGTLFADVNVEVIGSLVEKMDLPRGSFRVYGGEPKQYLYSQDPGDYTGESRLPAGYEEHLTGAGGYEKAGGKWIFYQRVGDTDAYAVLELENDAVVGDYFQSRTILILLLSFSCAFLLILYMAFSNRMSAPTRRLKDAMEQVEGGSLDVQVELNTRDEMEYVAEGFNKMVQKLKSYIEQVYVAQICQKDAELNALKMQIQPHYLYNTLDVIRMTALEEEARQTARLLEALAHQLRYVIGEQSERVSLKMELDAIREYFVIMRTRYEGRITLQIDARTEDLKLQIPKLLLQPVVENAIRHGLREKEGNGAVSIRACRRKSDLEIVVMDDGVGIDEEKLRRMTEELHDTEIGYAAEGGTLSVGMKNVYDRIKLNCGKEYGFSIESIVGMGTVVTYHLPIWEDFTENVESSDRG